MKPKKAKGGPCHSLPTKLMNRVLSCDNAPSQITFSVENGEICNEIREADTTAQS